MCLVCHDDFRLAQATRSRSLKQLRKGNVICGEAKINCDVWSTFNILHIVHIITALKSEGVLQRYSTCTHTFISLRTRWRRLRINAFIRRYWAEPEGRLRLKTLIKITQTEAKNKWSMYKSNSVWKVSCLFLHLHGSLCTKEHRYLPAGAFTTQTISFFLKLRLEMDQHWHVVLYSAKATYNCICYIYTAPNSQYAKVAALRLNVHLVRNNVDIWLFCCLCSALKY